ncbi:MAG: ATP-binding protein, partial [Verrucomicrobiota bacterium]
NEEKEKRAAELVIANKELLFQNEEKDKRAAELTQHRGQLEQTVAARTKDLDAARMAALSLMQDAQRQEQRVAEALAVQRALAAQLAEANQELESFSYSVSHDLRAPLRHIHGYVDMLGRAIEGQLSDKAQRYLKTIADASGEMGRLIDDLLAFSRMGRAELHEARVDLDRLVQECIRNLEMATRDRHIEWKISPLPQATGDPSMLRQVFANLLGNAVKYTRPRDLAVIEIGVMEGVECRVSSDGKGDECRVTSVGKVAALTLNPQPSTLTFFIRDNGVGFDPQYAHKLFGVFQRLHRADEFEGTGIGLANVRRIIARHSGRSWAEGKPGEGATFYFTLKGATS